MSTKLSSWCVCFAILMFSVVVISIGMAFKIAVSTNTGDLIDRTTRGQFLSNKKHHPTWNTGLHRAAHNRQFNCLCQYTMFHRSEKAIKYTKALDEARLNGHFHLVPNLARKLQKHDHHKQCILDSAAFAKLISYRLGKVGGMRKGVKWFDCTVGKESIRSGVAKAQSKYSCSPVKYCTWEDARHGHKNAWSPRFFWYWGWEDGTCVTTAFSDSSLHKSLQGKCGWPWANGRRSSKRRN